MIKQNEAGNGCCAAGPLSAAGKEEIDQRMLVRIIAGIRT
jgi:hypothetical protein